MMSGSSEQPSTQEILVSLLDFFAASPQEQSRRLGNYQDECSLRGFPAHLHDPLVELAEALETYASACSPREEHPETFYVGPLPAEVVSLMHELSRTINSLLVSDQKEFFAMEFLGKPEWQTVRELAQKGLAQWGELKPKVSLSLFETMCQVVD
jgi:hypothetical protein